MTVHLFEGIWSPSCANFAIRSVALDHMEDFAEETTRTLPENFYADDCPKSVSTVPKAIEIVRELCQLAPRGFRLPKWTSNSR